MPDVRGWDGKRQLQFQFPQAAADPLGDRRATPVDRRPETPRLSSLAGNEERTRPNAKQLIQLCLTKDRVNRSVG
jgi:hypothetical protein